MLPAQLKAAVDYYSTLLLFQYRGNPRASATIKIYAKQAIADMLEVDVQNGFGVDTAVGAQLDILGKYVGVPRNIGDPVPRPYYSFSDSDGTIRPNGFQDATNPAQNAAAIWYSALFLGSENTALTDAAYLLIIKLKIILNANDGTLASIQQFLHDFLPGLVALTDNKDMTLTYTLSNRIPVAPNVLKAYLPKPMGVGVNFITVTAAVTPDPLAKTLNVPHGDHGLHTVTSDDATCAAGGGVAPYSYNWQIVSGQPGIQLAFPSFMATQRFFAQGTAPTDITSIWRCIVADSRGIVAVSNDFTVHLKIQELP